MGSSMFDHVPAYSLVLLRICWGYFGWAAHGEVGSVFDFLKQMNASGEGENWDGLRSFMPYSNFRWTYDAMIYANTHYPTLMADFPEYLHDVMHYSAVAYGIGFLTPITGFLYLISYAFWFLTLGESRFVNHHYMKGLFILLLWVSQANRTFGVDSFLLAWWRRKRGDKNADLMGQRTVPRWNLLLLRLQVIVVFFFATSTKIQEDWLRGQPWIEYVATNYRGRPIVRWTLDFLMGSRPDGARLYGLFISYAGIFYDGGIILLLVYMSIRPVQWKDKWSLALLGFGVVTSSVFHTSNAYITQHIGQFPAMTWTLYSLFLQPDWMIQLFWWMVARAQSLSLLPILVDEKRKSSKKPPARVRKSPPHPALWKKVLVCLFIVGWIGGQIYIPTLHLWSPHRALWNSDSSRFSWRMMMTHWEVERADLHINHPESNRTMLTFPLKEFRIADALSRASDTFDKVELVVAISHYVADKIEMEKGERPKVYADIVAGVNVRTPQSRVRPGVDLAAVPRFSSDIYRPFLNDETPLTEEQWNEIPYPVLQFIRYFNIPLLG